MAAHEGAEDVGEQGVKMEMALELSGLKFASQSDDTPHIAGCTCAHCAGRGEADEIGLRDTHYQSGVAAPGTEAVSLQTLADYLRVDYWTDAGTIPRKYNLGDTGYYPKSGVLEYNVSGFSDKLGITDTNGISAGREVLVHEAFKLFEEVLGIEFRETTSNGADFYFSDNQSGAFATATGYGTGVNYTVVNVDATWSGGTSSYDDYTLQTILHEIGHGLGLGHQGLYNGSGNYNDSATFANDSWQGSMMSYFSQTENTFVEGDFEFLQTPMAVDWLALGAIYGGQTFGLQNAFNGDTVYGFNTNITSEVSDIWAQFSTYADRTASTIIDADGVDTLDVSGYGADQRIDLTVTTTDAIAPTTMDIGGSLGNLTLAVGTVIENAKGGSGDDVIFGNEGQNVLHGGSGNDTLHDSAGRDTYIGGSGNDTLVVYGDYDGFSFSSGTDSFIEMVAADTDLIDSSIEWITFSDQTRAFEDLVSTPTTPPSTPADHFYFSLMSSDSANALNLSGGAARDEDIVGFDGESFYRVFDGSDVGVTGDVDAFAVLSSNQILFSLAAGTTLSGVGAVDDSDVILFTAEQWGNQTSGTLSMYFDGSDYGLTDDGEDIDGIEIESDGSLLLSTKRNFSVSDGSGTGVSGRDEDIFRFNADSTESPISLYFDGSDVGLTNSRSDVDGLATSDQGDLLLSSVGTASVAGGTWFDEDVFTFAPSRLGPNTQGAFDPLAYFDGSSYGIGDEDLDAIDFVSDNDLFLIV